MSTVPKQRRIHTISKDTDTESQLHSQSSSPSQSSPSSLMVKNTNHLRHHHHQRTSNPLNVYKADQDRKGASFRIILFLLATTCYTAFLYSGVLLTD